MSKEQNEFIESIEGELTPEQVDQLLGLGDEGDTGTPEKGGEPDASTDEGRDTTDDDASSNATPHDKTSADAKGQPAEVEHNADNTVIMAKDGKHTIGYDKLVEAREAEKRWRAEAEARQQELDALRAEAQARADAGIAPTDTDNKVAAAEAAIEAGADPEIFGDFSEEALTNGIHTLVKQQVAAEVAEIKAGLAPIQQQHTASVVDSHYSAIYEAHPDADSVVESKELADWIASQPSFARSGYESVLSDGSTTEVIELFDTFKAATQPAGQQPAGDVKAQAKAAIARTAPPVPTSLSDFPGGRAAGVSKSEAMADMDAVQLLDNMDDMTPQQIEQYLNSL